MRFFRMQGWNWLALWVFCWACAGCGTDSNPEQAPAASKPQSSPSKATVPAKQDGPLANTAPAVAVAKSGAEVELNYEILSKPVPGQSVEIRLAFVPTVDAQALNAEISIPQPLQLAGEIKPSFSDIKLGQINEHRFSVSAPAGTPDGIYLVNIVVSLTRGGTASAKSFAIPLAIAAPSQPSAAAPAQ